VNRKRRGTLLLCLSGVLLCAALILTGYNLLSERNADRSASRTAKQLEAILPERGTDASVSASSQSPATTLQTVQIDGKHYIGLLTIPALNLSLPVNSTWSYPLLRKAPCCYQGSVQTGDLIIAGHNYKRHFGNLKLLSSGDEVCFTDADGYVYRYTVSSVETLAGKDIQGMTAGDWDLTLFTCTIGGARRVVVRCSLAS